MARLSGVKGFVAGVVILAAMDLVLSSDRGTKTFGTVVTYPTSWLAKWFDPTQPLIADHRQTAAAKGGSKGGGGVAGGVASGACSVAGVNICDASNQQIGPPNTQIPTSGQAAALYT